ncbi:MAG: cytidylate kinase-like family protein [SAR202 cluster bacterium]|jgi:cytidylate kinase|nr:cytidylate kinase-like family protein [SAR202 cluster bacterium]HJO59882.1 cytidylate kinase-like family protein [SAR202 cluster bacterium]|tara:strand:+ start:6654 stop:7373 length:720 start_codon:yes stop_codon:yes gene_type:complete
MYTITLGGMSGGGARDIGPIVAKKLEADYVDRIFLSNIAKDVGATVEALHQIEEKLPTRSEKWIHVVQRLLERSAVTGSAGDPYFGPGITALLTEEYEDIPQPTITRGHEVEDDVYIEALESTMKEMAADGDVVFIGRGGHVILKDMPNVLRVGVVASFEDRIKTLMTREAIDKDKAIVTLEQRDQARKYFFKKYFDLDEPDNPNLFHFTINSSEISINYAAEMVIQNLNSFADGRMFE